MRRGIKLISLSLCTLLLLPLASLIAATPTPCTICVLELQTLGIHGEEDQDFIIVSNRGATNVTSIQLKYYNTAGVLSDSMTLSIGTLNAGVTKAYVSTGLSAANPGMDSLKTMALSSSGGSVQLAKTSSGVTTIFDTVGWGGQSLVKEGRAAASQASGTTLSRKQSNGVAQDSNDNSDDFAVQRQSCYGAEFNEVQPFATDDTGSDMKSWVELRGVGSLIGDCLLVNSLGEEYSLASSSLPSEGQLSVVDGIINEDGTEQALHFGDSAGSLMLAGQSIYSGAKPIRLPLMSTIYAAMTRGQSWSLIDGIWRRTFSVTPGEPNRFTADKSVIDIDPTACESIRITEIMPNPLGEDTDKEWLEIHNESGQIVSLARCQVVVGSEAYGFLPDDALAPNEWRSVSAFFDADTSLQQLSLKNTDQNIVLFQRIIQDAPPVTIQSFSYSDAPEGQSWVKYSDGWRYAAPTMGVDNVTTNGTSQGQVTDSPSPTHDGQVPPDVATAPASAQANVVISEIFPNPAAPQSDDADEFVELHNVGDSAVDITGYKVQTGDSYSYSFVLPSTQLAPGAYLAITSADSSLSLANGSGRARLMAGDGAVVSETDPYETAPAGQSWADIDGQWQWTGQPTIGAANVLLMPSVLAAQKAATKKASSSAKATTKKTATAKTAKATKKPAAKSTSATLKPSAANANPFTDAPRLHLAILAGVGVLAVVYAAYEYRDDITNRFRQLRRLRTARQEAGRSFAGRRAH